VNTTANILEDRSAAPTFFPATDDGYNNVWDLGGESPMTDVGDGKPKNGSKGNDPRMGKKVRYANQVAPTYNPYGNDKKPEEDFRLDPVQI